MIPSLMAADAIVGQAGQSVVTLILNGSCSKKALEWDWDKLPDYGALKHLTADQITRKRDWCIYHKWLRLEYNRDGISLLYHSEEGRERVKQLWVERLMGWFEDWQELVSSNHERKREKTGQRLSSAVGSLSIPYASLMVKVLCGSKGIRPPREFPEFLEVIVDEGGIIVGVNPLSQILTNALVTSPA